MQAIACSKTIKYQVITSCYAVGAFFLLQYVVFIVVGTGVLFMVIFHVGVKEPPRSCTYEFLCRGSKRSASNWKQWFKEVQFYQVERAT